VRNQRQAYAAHNGGLPRGCQCSLSTPGPQPPGDGGYGGSLQYRILRNSLQCTTRNLPGTGSYSLLPSDAWPSCKGAAAVLLARALAACLLPCRAVVVAIMRR
jgi:hypothetical protein